ncbi:hypothetical protein BZG36_04775 [Bifiguratus adelaidae]|uniref:Ribosomal RNA-processing protein 1 n=1 Tax=Bifiguratus adelaidae TaxID=1938954 RepID=A0A261XWD2_9FUNG|nr:hypothetical protein BZG36_04775 [Bifiguratus adelaidae]
MAADNIAAPFGKQLAANDKATRDKAVKSLKLYLSRKAEFSHVEVLKLWKGLFYCFWMSDKPVVQQDLAETLAGLISDMPAENALDFLKAFYETMANEWHGIDRIRLDKYYLLLRRAMSRSFQFLADSEWEPTLVNDYVTMLSEGPLHPANLKVPDAIRYHLIDIYLDEFEKVVHAQLATTPETEDIAVPTTVLLNPFINIMARSNKPILMKKTVEGIFDRILEQFAKELAAMEQEDDMSDGEESEERKPFIHDIVDIVKQLRKRSEEADLADSNKRRLRTLVANFKSAAGEIGVESISDSNEEDAEMEEADKEEEPKKAPPPSKQDKKRKADGKESKKVKKQKHKAKAEKHTNGDLAVSVKEPIAPEQNGHASIKDGEPAKKRVKWSMRHNTIKHFRHELPITTIASTHTPSPPPSKSALKTQNVKKRKQAVDFFQ